MFFFQKDLIYANFSQVLMSQKRLSLSNQFNNKSVFKKNLFLLLAHQFFFCKDPAKQKCGETEVQNWDIKSASPLAHRKTEKIRVKSHFVFNVFLNSVLIFFLIRFKV